MPARTSSRPRPSALATFVGRVDERERLDLAAREGRLVTVVGPAGSGKSRLVAEWVATRGREDDGELDADVRVDVVPGGEPPAATPFVVLASVRSRDDVVRATAAALGVPLAQARSAAVAERTVLEALADWRGPVVLDDVEGAREAVADLAAAWLAASPALVVVTTSRVRLGIEGERLVTVGPLSLAPGPGGAPSEALSLFLERARSYRPDLDATQPDVVGLVDDLEGLPLALELAAARLVVLDPADLRRRVREKTLETLARGGASADSLGKRLAWSLELLTPEERWAIVRLAVFTPDFTVADAERALEGAATSAIDLVASLREHHLLRERAALPGRLAPWEGLRELVLATAEPSELADAMRHHARDLATRLDRVVDAPGVDGTEAVALVRHERANFRAALDRALEDPTSEGRVLASLYVGIARLAWLDGATEATHALAARLERDPRLSAVDRARVVHDAGTLAIVHAPGDVRVRLEAALAALGDQAAPHVRAPLELALANALMFLGELDAALATVTRARAHAVGHPVLEARGAFVAAALAGASGTSDVALRAAREALRRAEEARDALTAVRAAVSLVTSELEAGRLRDARRTLERARAHATAIGDQAGLAYVALSEATASALEGDVARGARELEASARVLARSRWRSLEAHARLRLGLAELELGDLGAAEDALEHALELFEEIGMEAPATSALAARALVRRALGDAGRAAEDAAEARARSARLGRSASGAEALLAAFDGAPLEGEAKGFEAQIARRLAKLAPAAPREGAPKVLWLSADGFALADDAKVRLDHKPRLLGVVRALAEASASGDGFAARGALVALAWPGERMLEHAAANRLNVALSSLRKLGLPLETGPRGVRLNARVRSA